MQEQSLLFFFLFAGLSCKSLTNFGRIHHRQYRQLILIVTLKNDQCVYESFMQHIRRYWWEIHFIYTSTLTQYARLATIKWIVEIRLSIVRGRYGAIQCRKIIPSLPFYFCTYSDVKNVFGLHFPNLIFQIILWSLDFFPNFIWEMKSLPLLY